MKKPEETSGVGRVGSNAGLGNSEALDMKLLVSSSTLTLCEAVLKRYEELLMDGHFSKAPPEFKAWVSDSLAEVRSVRHKHIAGVVEQVVAITAETLEGSLV